MNDTQILQALGLDKAPAELQKQTLTSVNNIIEMRTAGLVQDIMTEEQLATFSSMSKTKTPEAVRAWISDEVVDAQKLYDAALEDYIAEKQQ